MTKVIEYSRSMKAQLEDYKNTITMVMETHSHFFIRENSSQYKHEWCVIRNINSILRELDKLIAYYEIASDEI